MENLSGFMLDCFNFYMMRGKFPLSLSGRLLYPLETVHGDRMPSGVKEMCQLLQSKFSMGFFGVVRLAKNHGPLSMGMPSICTALCRPQLRVCMDSQ